MSEHWPPEWGDPDAEDLDGDDGDGDDLTGQLAEVRVALASLALPALPDAFAARISAAIAAEAATRTEPGGADGESATARSLSPDGSFSAAADGGTTTAPPPRRRSRRPGAGRAAGRSGPSETAGPPASRPPRRGYRRLGSARVIGSLVACLVIAGFGFLIVHAPSDSTSSSVAAGPASSSSAAAVSGHSAAGTGSTGSLPVSASAEHGGRSSGFVVRDTGTRYQAATLAGQVQAALAATGGSSSSGPEPAASAAASASASAPSAFSAGGAPPSTALAGCVARLTGNVTPSLVDRATYAGKPAYVIVVPRRAWVVGLGCTSAKPQLITTIALAGLSGNLCALGSV
jgi:hypothetical protein